MKPNVIPPSLNLPLPCGSLSFLLIVALFLLSPFETALSASPCSTPDCESNSADEYAPEPNVLPLSCLPGQNCCRDKQCVTDLDCERLGCSIVGYYCNSSNICSARPPRGESWNNGTPRDRCENKGTCPPPYQCNPMTNECVIACKGGNGFEQTNWDASCQYSNECCNGLICLDVCKAPEGAPCRSESDCVANLDLVCDNGRCKSCGEAGSTKTKCCEGLFHTALGKCAKPNGAECVAGLECLSGLCSSRVCSSCENAEQCQKDNLSQAIRSSCDRGECKGCTAAGETPPNGEPCCEGTLEINDEGKNQREICLLKDGEKCTSPNQCKGGECKVGVCKEKPVKAACQSDGDCSDLKQCCLEKSAIPKEFCNPDDEEQRNTCVSAPKCGDGCCSHNETAISCPTDCQTIDWLNLPVGCQPNIPRPNLNDAEACAVICKGRCRSTIGVGQNICNCNGCSQSETCLGGFCYEISQATTFGDPVMCRQTCISSQKSGIIRAANGALCNCDDFIDGTVTSTEQIWRVEDRNCKGGWRYFNLRCQSKWSCSDPSQTTNDDCTTASPEAPRDS